VEPLDIVLKLRGRAPEALVKEVAKEEYVLRTEISLGRLCICHSLRNLSNQWPFLDPRRWVSAKTIALVDSDDEEVEVG